jgi:hypothetical protein
MQERARPEPEPEKRHRTGAGMDKNQRMKQGRGLCLLWLGTEYDSLLRNGFGGTVSSFDCLEGSIYSLDYNVVVSHIFSSSSVGFGRMAHAAYAYHQSCREPHFVRLRISNQLRAVVEDERSWSKERPTSFP